MTTQFAFDTLAFVKRLAASGMAERQAEALAQALTEHAFDDLVTKSHLENALDKLELRLTMRMGAISIASATLTVALIGALIVFN